MHLKISWIFCLQGIFYMVVFEVSVIHLKKLFLLRRSRLANTQGYRHANHACQIPAHLQRNRHNFFRWITGSLKDQHGIFSANNFLKWGKRGESAGQSKKDRRFHHEGLAHRYVCSLAKVVPHAKLRSFILLFYISANGSLVYPVLYMSISYFLS